MKFVFDNDVDIFCLGFISIIEFVGSWINL
jgi:hypothetical protein